MRLAIFENSLGLLSGGSLLIFPSILFVAQGSGLSAEEARKYYVEWSIGQFIEMAYLFYILYFLI